MEKILLWVAAPSTFSSHSHLNGAVFSKKQSPLSSHGCTEGKRSSLVGVGMLGALVEILGWVTSCSCSRNPLLLPPALVLLQRHDAQPGEVIGENGAAASTRRAKSRLGKQRCAGMRGPVFTSRGSPPLLFSSRLRNQHPAALHQQRVTSPLTRVSHAGDGGSVPKSLFCPPPLPVEPGQL